MPAQSDRQYDAFISYSHKDRPWVDSYLLAPLDAAGLAVAIDYRDFDVGPLAHENMERFVDSSRHVLLVLSPNWTASEWSGFEYCFALADDPAGRRRKLIPLLIAPTDLPRSLALRTYADFREPSAYQRELTKVIRAISPLVSPAPSPDVTTPMSPRPSQPTAPTAHNWQADLADLLTRSGRSHPASRRALCIEIGVDPDLLTFGEAASRDFSVQLVSMLDATGNTDALIALGGALGTVVKGTQAVKLHAVCEALHALART